MSTFEIGSIVVTCSSLSITFLAAFRHRLSTVFVQRMASALFAAAGVGVALAIVGLVQRI